MEKPSQSRKIINVSNNPVKEQAIKLMEKSVAFT